MRSILSTLLWIWLAIVCVSAVSMILDMQQEVHGDACIPVRSDGPSFARWLECTQSKE